MMANSDSEDNDVGGICDHCQKSCQTIHTFLRHVSHSESCKASYSQDFLETLRKKAKRISKRKFYRNLSKRQKVERYESEKHWRKANAKKRYVKRSTYKWDDGKEFESVFKNQFDIAKSEVEGKLGQITPKVEYLDWIAEEESIDYVFEKEIDMMEDNTDKEEFDCDKIEANLKEKFDERFEKAKAEEQEKWKALSLARILHNDFFKLTLNKAYLGYIEDFKKIYDDAVEVSLDQVMFNAESIEVEDMPRKPELFSVKFEVEVFTAFRETFDKQLRIEVSNRCRSNGFNEKLLDFTKQQFDLKMKRDYYVKEFL